jgi:hypothetical protein
MSLTLHLHRSAVQENNSAERNCLACAPTCMCALRPCSPTPSPTPAPVTPKPTPRPMMAITLPTGASVGTTADPLNSNTETSTITDTAGNNTLSTTTSVDDTFSDDTDVGQQGASPTIFTTPVIAGIGGGLGGLLLLIALIVCIVVARRGKRNRNRDANTNDGAAAGAQTAINDVALAQSHYSSPPTLSTLSNDSIYTPARASHLYGAAPVSAAEFVTVRDSTYHAPPAATTTGDVVYHAPPAQPSYDAPPSVAQFQ